MKIKLIILFIVSAFVTAFSQSPCPTVPSCNYQNNFQTAGAVLYVNTDSVTNITYNSATLYGTASSMDAHCNYGGYPIQMTAIAAWSTDCNPVCYSNLSALDTATIVYQNSYCSNWVNNVETAIQLKNLHPGTTYYIRYMVCRTFYPNNIPPFATSFDPYYNIGNIISFTTKSAPTPISNNTITSGNQVICPQGNPLTYVPHQITASAPSGGNNNYGSNWQTSPDGINWSSCTGVNSLTYTPAPIVGNLPYSNAYYRRIVTSAGFADTSNSISITYLPNGYIPILNISPDGNTTQTMRLNLSVNNAISNYNVVWRDSLLKTSNTIINGVTGQNLTITLNNNSTSHIYQASVNYDNSCPTYNSSYIYISPPDGNGNYYPAVKIGRQLWTIANLKATKFNDGTAIKKVKNNNNWCDYSWYANDSLLHKNKLGALYNINVINNGNNKNVCPSGWKAADIMNWYELFETIGGVKNGAILLKSLNQWDIQDYQSNVYNFNALPGGEKFVAKTYQGKDESASWWGMVPMQVSSATLYQSSYFQIIDSDNNIYLIDPNATQQNAARSQHSIRCISR